MQLKLLKSKLHMATATRCDLTYHGSLTIDPELMEAVGIVPYEAILVSNTSTGAARRRMPCRACPAVARSSSTAPWPGSAASGTA